MTMGIERTFSIVKPDAVAQRPPGDSKEHPTLEDGPTRPKAQAQAQAWLKPGPGQISGNLEIWGPGNPEI